MISTPIGTYPYTHKVKAMNRESFEYFETLFNQEVLDSEKYTITSGDWNSARTELDHYNYKDWEHYKPGTRKAINDGTSSALLKKNLDWT